MKKSNGMVLIVLSVIFVTGCKTTETALNPTVKTNVPSKWDGTYVEEGAVVDGWLKSFDDDLLVTIVKEAINQNFDLETAAVNLDIAQQNAIKAGALLKPMVNLGGGGSRTEGISNVSDRVSRGVSLDISWELDVWGRIRAGKTAALRDVEASAADYDFARKSLAAQTAKSYILATEAKLQMELANSFVENFQEVQRIVEAKFDAGLVSKQDVHLAKADLVGAKEAYTQAKGAYKEALRSLELLLGRYPGADIKVAEDLPQVPGKVPVGLPSQLLERRPDIVAARNRVEAAFKKSEEAKKAKLPRIALTSNVGYASSELNEVMNLEQAGANLAANFLAPLFDGGKLEADVQISNAKQRQAVAQFNKIALAAFGDVEASLSNEKLFAQREEFLQEASKENGEALNIAQLQYDNGAVDLLSVLQMQLRADNSKINLLRIQNARLIQRINLHLALGGDFE